MSNWTSQNYDDALKGSNELLRAATDLNDALGAGGGATSPEQVLKALRDMRELLDTIKAAAEWA